MKLEESYAHALFGSTKDKSGHERDVQIKNFFALIQSKGHQRLLPKILSALTRIENKEKSRHTATILVAPKSRVEIEKEVVAELEKHIGNKVEYKVCEDESVIGGYTASAGGIRIDSSHKRALLNLWDKLRV